MAALRHDPLVLLPVVPALSLIAQFMGSTILTESISLSKYPETYRVYQERVGMILPLPWGWILSEEKKKRDGDHSSDDGGK